MIYIADETKLIEKRRHRCVATQCHDMHSKYTNCHKGLEMFLKECMQFDNLLVDCKLVGWSKGANNALVQNRS